MEKIGYGHVKPVVKFKTLDELKKSPTRKLYFTQKEKLTPHFAEYGEDVIHQIDILHLPNDGGYRYALVVVDIGSRKGDARPMKTRNMTEIIKALKSMYRGRILRKPKTIEADNEFSKKAFKDFTNENDITLRIKAPYRHRSMAIVERRNQDIGFYIFQLQNEVELKSKEPVRDWIKVLPEIIRELNKKYRHKPHPEDDKTFLKPPKCNTKMNCTLLDVGDKVHYQLDIPVAAHDPKKRLKPPFRKGDLKFSPNAVRITNIILRPDQPPMYQLEGREKILYTREQLKPG